MRVIKHIINRLNMLNFIDMQFAGNATFGFKFRPMFIVWLTKFAKHGQIAARKCSNCFMCIRVLNKTIQWIIHPERFVLNYEGEESCKILLLKCRNI